MAIVYSVSAAVNWAVYRKIASNTAHPLCASDDPQHARCAAPHHGRQSLSDCQTVANPATGHGHSGFGQSA